LLASFRVAINVAKRAEPTLARGESFFYSTGGHYVYTTICNSAPSEYLATLALRHRHSIIERNMGIIRRNVALLTSFFSKHQELFEWNEPKAGPIAFPRYLGSSVEQFCDELVRHSGVLLLPGIRCDDILKQEK
jgi:aspartate/methionine/tyrosine aminotransferase